VNSSRRERGAKRRRLPISANALATVFRAANWGIPIYTLVFISGHLFFHWRLSWELMTLIILGLLPLALPLLGFYIGKIGSIETNHSLFDSEDFEDSGTVSLDSAPSPSVPATVPPGPPTPSASGVTETTAPTPSGPEPNFDALTSEEQKMLRTLWKFQSEYLRQDKDALWGFVIGSGSPDYRQFVRAVHSLMQRGFVKQQRGSGMVFLTERGILYCNLNADLIEKEGDAWTTFSSG
jgi:hypothetical protein